ncbi:hypothetical protein NEHOM01_2032 [Nematocida homosporus]|uniref:uncharacterized protein n=1 Tax=Nematocida homosporus TaxID=1912981 RepID=UPI00221FC9B5|nr:uncharacterized protein NEHOM01_2032 [Nematocida homosporus]KAI5187236.1 hypothetical protein NEHOM01_2032 [Nematocida homosporus]
MHVCITGGASGLGESLAILFKNKDWQVTIIDRNKPKHPKLSACTYINHDFSSVKPLKITCDILILNHATFDGFTPFTSLTTNYVNQYIQINLSAHLQMIQNSQFNRLVYINSVLSIASFPNVALYSATKAFMHTFLNSLRREGLNILTVYPYKIDTPLFATVRTPFVLSTHQTATAIYQAIINKQATLYLPSIFRLSYLLALLPHRLQNWLHSLIYRLVIT